jgi:hypothetical protein
VLLLLDLRARIGYECVWRCPLLLQTCKCLVTHALFRCSCHNWGSKTINQAVCCREDTHRWFTVLHQQSHLYIKTRLLGGCHSKN